MQKFMILCIIRISNFTARDSRTVVCYLIALVHPVRILTRLRCRLVKFYPVGEPVMARLSRWPVAATVTATIAQCAKTHGNRADDREFDGRPISEANNTISVFGGVRKIDFRTGGVTAVKNAALWTSCCISRAGTSAAWIVEKVILCIICIPNFTVRF